MNVYRFSIAFKFLPIVARKKVIFISLIQVILSLLDLLGVALIGVVAALSVSGVQFSKPGTKVEFVLKSLKLTGFNFQNQVAILAVCATIFLVVKTVLSWFFSKYLYNFLGQQSTDIASELYEKIINLPINHLRKISMQKVNYNLLDGVSLITIGILGSFTTVLSDISLILLLGTGLFFVAPSVAFFSLIFFGSLSFFLNVKLGSKSREIGVQDYVSRTDIAHLISETFGAFREISVRDAKKSYAMKLRKLRDNQSHLQADTALMPLLNKYSIETAVIVGGLLLSAAQFAFNDARHAVGIFSIFLAAGARLAPAVLRLQQSSYQIKRSLASAEGVIDLYEELLDAPRLPEFKNTHLDLDLDLDLGLSVNQLTFGFPDSKNKILENLNLEFNSCSFNALVGDSGSGKSTLVDLIMGMLSPNEGEIRIFGLSPHDLISSNNRIVGYVPQEVFITEGTIASNISLGFELGSIDENLIIESLKNAKLLDFVNSLPEGIHTRIGVNGIALSGGQRQRLGIARALVTRPKILILDESTSSLDAKTEGEVIDSIYSLKNEMMLIVLAHRLSTIINADQIYYLSRGRIIGNGNFEKLRSTVPEFAERAKMLGI